MKTRLSLRPRRDYFGSMTPYGIVDRLVERTTFFKLLEGFDEPRSKLKVTPALCELEAQLDSSAQKASLRM